MTRLVSTWDRYPQSVRRVTTKLDNIALMPASELKSLVEWQARAQRLPAGRILLVLPRGNRQLQGAGDTSARGFAVSRHISLT